MTVIAYFFLFICLKVVYSVNLNLNPNATIADDVKTITHDSIERQVVIELKTTRRCDNPYFIVRLSGKSLYILDLIKHEHDDLEARSLEQTYLPRKNTYYFSYPPLQDSGTYYIEVMVVFCKLFKPDRYIEGCIENPQLGRNIVNSLYNFKHDASIDQTTALKNRPRWVLQKVEDPEIANNGFLPTRYQTRQCDDGVYCEPKLEDIERHQQYDWTDPPDWTADMLTVHSNTANHVPPVTDPPTRPVLTVCFIGGVQAKDLVYRANGLNGRNGMINFAWIELKHFNTLSTEAIETQQCSYAVISYEHPAIVSAHEANTNEGEKHFAGEFRALLQKISAPVYTGSVKFSVVSMDFIGLSAQLISCPPLDPRSPAVVDALNNVAKHQCAEFKVRFIDMRHIAAPLWDAALDFVQPNSKVLAAEAAWILHLLFRSTVLSQESVTLYPGPPVLPDGLLVRFTDSNQFYMVDKGELRVFPDWHTFEAMGFAFDEVRAIVEWKRSAFPSGPPLPAQ